MDIEGLMLLINDGELVYWLMYFFYEVFKMYLVMVMGLVLCGLG